MRLCKRRDGLSALFDAILFFIIILAAIGSLFRWDSALSASTTGELSSRDLGRFAADIHSSALECDVGPVNYSTGGAGRTFIGSVHDCLRTILVSYNPNIECELSGPIEAVRGTYALLVEKPFHFEVRASAGGPGPGLVISEHPEGSESPGAVRWTSASPLIVNGSEGELTLYIWR